MPKKFQGTNTKASEARARKAAQAAEVLQNKQKAAEDEYWRDDDKLSNRKLQRKEAMEQKRLNALSKKKELDELYKAEEETLKKSSKHPTTSKVTRAEIDRSHKKEEQQKLAEAHSAALKTKNISVQNAVVDENINKVIAKNIGDGNVEARSVEEAISVLSTQDELDRHPERRLKASFKKYEQEQMPILKAANPDMRLSQLRQVLRKEWQKSPENPLNQKHLAYNAKDTT